MKIAICGSMAFSKEMLDLKKQLEGLNHVVVVPAGIENFVSGKIKVEDKWEKIDHDVFKSYFEKIKQNDAILVINKTKNNIENYVGGNSLIEIAFAHILDKKIFLLNKIPNISYESEIVAMKPIVLNGNLDLIK
jgi:hypothetical protein